MTVLWDGTAHAPWGRMLFAEESAHVEPARPEPPWGDRTSQIRWAVVQQGDQWFTADQIASAVSIDRDLVSNTLARLVNKGWIERARKLPMQRQQYRRIPKSDGAGARSGRDLSATQS
jgi:hypothetical protein